MKGKPITWDHVTVQSEHLNWDPTGVRTVLSISKFAFYFNDMDISSTSWSSINYPKFSDMWPSMKIKSSIKWFQLWGGVKISACTKRESDFLQKDDNMAELSSFFPVSGQGSFLPTTILTSPCSGLGDSQCIGILYPCFRLISEGSILPLKTTFLYALHIPLFPFHSQIIGIETEQGC